MMGFDLLLAMTIAYFLTKNTVQDLAWKARGEDPPSFRREQARWERRQARAAQRGDDGPGRQFWRNVWNDAVASADEHRARAAKKAAEKRHAKWADKDLAAAEDEAYKLNERLGPTTGGEEPIVHDQVVWRCEQCGTRMMNAGTDAYERGERICRACADPESGEDAPRRCYFCHHEYPTKDLWPIRIESGATVGACPDCWNDQTTHRPGPAANEPAPQEPSTAFEPAAPEPGDAEIIQFADWQRPAASDTAKESDLSAEITGLRSAIAYADRGAAAAAQAAQQDELAVASLEAGGTTGPAIASFYAAMEGHRLNQGNYNATKTDLVKQLQITEAYEANRGAGSREFVTND